MRTAMRKGFTLIETVVTVGIVAAMAAVVIPQVAKQFDAADPTRVQNDLKNIQTAVEAFSVNVKALPGDIDDLANQTALLEDSSLTTSATALPTFSATENGLWKGPYIDVSVVDLQDTDMSITTGYGALILDTFVCYNSLDNQHGISFETRTAGAVANDNACPNTTGQKFLALQITGVKCLTTAGSAFLSINELFDGANETSPAANGRVRCTVAGAGTKAAGVDVVHFLSVPISE
jgi:prepilin-type N-terminal cleavage/methylation domain-containing protein